MAERSDMTTDWSESPRIIEVADPSTSLTAQDLHDTCRSDTKQPGEGGDTLENMDDDSIIDSAGKEDLGGGTLVGITATLQNAQVAFESRVTPAQEGTITNADATGTLFEDNTATLITNNVERGAVLINFDDLSITEILEVLTETTARTRVLRAGTNNDYGLGDNYKIWNVIQCNLEGGNVVAVDEVDSEISPIFPTAFTQIVRTSSSSATLAEITEIQFASFEGAVTVDVVSGVSGIEYPIGTGRRPVNNLTDALQIAQDQGLSAFRIVGDITISIGPDFSGYGWIGQSTDATTITVPAGATVTDCEYEDARVVGTLDGRSRMRECVMGTLAGVGGTYFRCLIEGELTLAADSEFLNCYSQAETVATLPGIVIGANQLTVRDYFGFLNLSGKTDTDLCTLDMSSGTVNVADDNTTGTITLRGLARWLNVDTYAGTATVSDNFVTAQQLKEVWKILGLDKGDPIEVTPTGIDSDSGDIDINFTGDGISLTRQVRQ